MSDIPVQLRPFLYSLKPSLHLHSCDWYLFTQIWSHPPFPTLHSSISSCKEKQKKCNFKSNEIKTAHYKHLFCKCKTSKHDNGGWCQLPHDVRTTLLQRHFTVLMSFQRPYNIVLTLCASWDAKLTNIFHVLLFWKKKIIYKLPSQAFLLLPLCLSPFKQLHL